MPLYFFDTYDGLVVTQDKTGLVLDNLDLARREAVKALPGMARDALPDGEEAQFSVRVRDEAGGTRFRAVLSFRCHWM